MLNDAWDMDKLWNFRTRMQDAGRPCCSTRSSATLPRLAGHPPDEDLFETMADMLSKQFRVLRLDELLVTRIPEAISVINLFASYGPAA